MAEKLLSFTLCCINIHQDHSNWEDGRAVLSVSWPDHQSHHLNKAERTTRDLAESSSMARRKGYHQSTRHILLTAREKAAFIRMATGNFRVYVICSFDVQRIGGMPWKHILHRRVLIF
jgi:hypothetical protein